jgi:hypothetical protein
MITKDTSKMTSKTIKSFENEIGTSLSDFKTKFPKKIIENDTELVYGNKKGNYTLDHTIPLTSDGFDVCNNNMHSAFLCHIDNMTRMIKEKNSQKGNNCEKKNLKFVLIILNNLNINQIKEAHNLLSDFKEWSENSREIYKTYNLNGINFTFNQEGEHLKREPEIFHEKEKITENNWQSYFTEEILQLEEKIIKEKNTISSNMADKAKNPNYFRGKNGEIIKEEVELIKEELIKEELKEKVEIIKIIKEEVKEEVEEEVEIIEIIKEEVEIIKIIKEEVETDADLDKLEKEYSYKLNQVREKKKDREWDKVKNKIYKKEFHYEKIKFNKLFENKYYSRLIKIPNAWDEVIDWEENFGKKLKQIYFDSKANKK